MRRIIFMLLLMVSVLFAQDDPYRTEGFEDPQDSSQYYDLYIFRIYSNPGGWLNRNTSKFDSLMNSLVVYTDTSQLFIRNDTLMFNLAFIANALDTVVFDSLSLKFAILEPNPPPLYGEGRVFYDSNAYSFVYYTEEPDVSLNVGRELWIRVYNNSGVTIPNGSAVYPTGAVAGGWGTVALALADADSTSNVIGIATHSIEDGTFGYITKFGDVRDMKTVGLQIGGTAYLSADTAGRPTTTVPDAPNNAIALGGITSVGVSGSMFVIVERFNPINGEAAIGFQDSAYTLTPVVQNTWYQITNDNNNLFTYNTDVGHDITLSGDTIYCAEAGVYEFIISHSFAGAINGVFEFGTKQNGTFVPDAQAVRKTGSADIGNVGYSCKPRLAADTPVTFWIRNTGNTVEPIFAASTVIIRQVR